MRQMSFPLHYLYQELQIACCQVKSCDFWARDEFQIKFLLFKSLPVYIYRTDKSPNALARACWELRGHTNYTKWNELDISTFPLGCVVTEKGWQFVGSSLDNIRRTMAHSNLHSHVSPIPKTTKIISIVVKSILARHTHVLIKPRLFYILWNINHKNFTNDTWQYGTQCTTKLVIKIAIWIWF